MLKYRDNRHDKTSVLKFMLQFDKTCSISFKMVKTDLDNFVRVVVVKVCF